MPGPISVYRYSAVHGVRTALDPFSDVLDWLSYMTSQEYLCDVLVRVHSLTSGQAKSRAKQIVPHVRDAISFVRQAASGPEEVSFLPVYYAILNLSKVCVLLGPRYADLPHHRWHGAIYKVGAKDSHSVRTEEITLKAGGALNLLYETLTGVSITNDRVVKMGDVYALIRDISAEYTIAAGQPASLAILKFATEEAPRGFRVRVKAVPRNPRLILTTKRLPCLTGFRKAPKKDNIFVSPILQCPESKVPEKLRDHLHTSCLYFSEDGNPYTAICSRAFPMPEEFPIALLFFHMSSVVRYKPEFLARIQESRWWPVLLTARRQSLFKFMLLSWSFVHREQFIVKAY